MARGDSLQMTWEGCVWEKEDMHQPGESEKRGLAGAGQSVGLAIAYSCITSSSREDLPLGDASPMLTITRPLIGVSISYFILVHYLPRLSCQTATTTYL
jgi:hypothetical protein